ncbi:HutD family protein [Aquabacterium sp.]|uniref:HutD/Ves family protein n=1 Tax=Aquabacterium sp. TaxID=1872578 RepID=UPI002BFBC1C6|nr:HutD family protein [Aquabacterium sp.]HSW07586.1 HutD family protein [Aquabacterium sp.]
MTLEVIQAEHTAPRRWRNGGGITRDLFSAPATDAWAWRVSLADVEQDGPFSAYPGITRWFTVVQGAGVVLQFDAARQVLDSHSAPLQFDGALQPDCHLQHGSTRDLNLMTRDGVCRGTMQRATADDEWFSPLATRALFAAEPMRLQIDDADAARLPAMSLVVSQHAAHQRWRVQAESDTPAAWWLAIELGRSA